MTKKYRSILLAVTALSVLASEACGKKLPDHGDQATAAAVFQETVAEMNGERILAEPAKDSAELLPADRIYRIFYEEAKKTGASYDLKTTERMVASLGKNGVMLFGVARRRCVYGNR